MSVEDHKQKSQHHSLQSVLLSLISEADLCSCKILMFDIFICMSAALWETMKLGDAVPLMLRACASIPFGPIWSDI